LKTSGLNDGILSPPLLGKKAKIAEMGIRDVGYLLIISRFDSRVGSSESAKLL
jgi:hypothetical protein